MANLSKSGAAGFLLTGAAIGATVALLYAPKSGTQTRRDVRRITKKTADILDDFQEDFSERMTDWVERGKDALDDAMKCVEEGRCQIQKFIRMA
jgi:gas vesicle protein